MATFTKQKLSASTDGRPVQVVATTSTGTTIHTATSVADEFDEVWLWAQNHTDAQVDLVVEFGGTASGDRVEVGVPPQAGPVPVIPGWILRNSLLVTAFADTASGISLGGYVNRINQA